MMNEQNNIRTEYKDTKVTALLKKCIVVFIDCFLFTATNVSICFLANDGQIFNGGAVYGTYGREVLFNPIHLAVMMAIVASVHFLLGMYESVWKFIGSDELVRGTACAIIDTIALLLVDRLIFFRITGSKLAWYSYIFELALSLLVIIIPRFAFRTFKKIPGIAIPKDAKNNRVMIVGAGYAGNFIIETLRNYNYINGYPTIAVDDNPGKLNKKINGVKVAGNCTQIPELVIRYNINTIIIAMPSATAEEKKKVMDLAMSTNAKVKISPSIQDMLDNSGNRRIRDIDIRDLLARPEVKLDRKVCQYLVGKTILVTGGGGSIGSEICNQVARYGPKSIVIFDIYENNAFKLLNELKEKYNDEIDIQVRIGSVRDVDRIKEIFEEFHPDIVFHAAAHKHVPLMEDSPCEAVKNNVFGTYNVAVACNSYNVKKMIILSTDKTVNPTNVMGCTKRLTEITIEYMNSISENTQYAAVRFGNVLGSHGSVVPIFQDQIENGGPVTVTDSEITRYFMTIPEAAQLVCQAGGLAKGGEIFLLDMGEPVKILDLAKKMIRLAGYTEEEIPIKFIGLRPGEKMYEELGTKDELKTSKKTQNDKIFVTAPFNVTKEEFKHIFDVLNTIDNDNIRTKLKEIVPNYQPKENQ